ncbi:uncharacterized protein BXZ73DRAFT_48415 [Epithele typhae]|uniref:uncharacterized protein n=1 Tax=Epithele typhae TaxID=378194 RepID=UPI002007E276|nr:uncharacterized protein BXZ73DRAFT_48415 [Epithele typhae]KAH9928543.1 hypothetical protein BXZ73DRAFT_48415 [Epithele typhae]
MPSIYCIICRDTLGDTSSPMAAACGHVFCLSCTTFHFANTPSCPICRKEQSLDGMIRLFPTWEDGEPRRDARPKSPVDAPPTSPIWSINAQAERTADAVKRAIADQLDPEEALTSCNTFVNSIPERDYPELNTELLQEVQFQLSLMATKLKDDYERKVALLEQEVQVAQQAKSMMRDKLQRSRSRREQEKLQYEKDIRMLQRDKDENVRIFRDQGEKAMLEVSRLQRSVDAAMVNINDILDEKEKAQKGCMRYKKKYYALKASVLSAKRAAGPYDDSDDLIIAD